jgi:hypothetical protein
MNAFSAQLGVPLQVSLVSGESVSGTLFGYDAAAGIVVIEEEQPGVQRRNYHFLRISAIANAHYTDGPRQPVLPLPAVNLAKLRSKQHAVLNKQRAEAAKIGVGVSEFAQSLFNTISRTCVLSPRSLLSCALRSSVRVRSRLHSYPCTWEKDVIVVLQEVRISSPYTAHNCESSNSAALERVRKVVSFCFFHTLHSATYTCIRIFAHTAIPARRRAK